MSDFSDSKFFTNEPEATLYDRFQKILSNTQYFDMLVGYFRSSGFHRLQDAFKDIEHTRILVGLNVDKPIADAVQKARGFSEMQNSEDTRKWISEQTIADVTRADDTKQIEDGINTFVDYLKTGKIEIRAYPTHDIHAKVYIMRHPQNSLDFGRVVTGSSNFSDNGLVSQREFNVELKDKPDVDFALEHFEKLWDEGIDVTQEYIDTIVHKTPVNKDITPYELYLKFLYEYFKEEIDDDLTPVDITLPAGFMDLAYQKDAVKNAKRILEKYNGVFLADVVGLGKTYITAMLLQILGDGKKLVLCPPNLKDYWQETLLDFNVPASVQSQYQIDDENAEEYDKYKYIVIDEAHRFRNQQTNGYAKLKDIVCKGKKVILVSATPFNNDLSDIDSLLRLFMNMKHSNLAGLENLESFFINRRAELNRMEKTYGKGSPEYNKRVKLNANLVRENILRPLMVRRTRTEIKQDYKSDIEKQHLKFPDVTPPKRLTYMFSDNVEKAFNKTIELLKQGKDGEESKFKYTRYMPLLYLINPESGQTQQQQRNTGYFMKMLLVKRLESSFYAFKCSLKRFEKSYVDFIKMYQSGTVYIGKKDISKYLEEDDDESIDRFLSEGKITKYDSKEFNNEFLPDLESDLATIRELISIWENIDEDPKYNEFHKQLSELQGKQVIVFTESKDTADYLFNRLTAGGSGFDRTSVFEMSGEGGVSYSNHYTKKSWDVNGAKKQIELDFNPKGGMNRSTAIKILLTTDVLSEGVNLHKSNQIMNYDLPWNPTRIMQRVGRVNRVGTKHDNVYTYSFFPTSQSNQQLGLEENIKAKITMFQNMLGDDNPLLDQDEAPQQHHLSDQLYNNIQQSMNVTETEVADPTNHYLKMIREIRDNDITLYNKIKLMPRKIKVAQKGKHSALITFFRKGLWKDFVITTTQGNTSHLSWQDAIGYFECSQTEKSVPMPEFYYDLIKQNKDSSTEASSLVADDEIKAKRGKNAGFVVDVIDNLAKGKLGKTIVLDEEERNLCMQAKTYIPEMSAKPAKDMSDALRKIMETAKADITVSPADANKLLAKMAKDIMALVRDYYKYWKPREFIGDTEATQREIILSKCFIGDK